MKSNTFSIIIPVYNSEDFLIRCLDSIKRQKYQNFEVLLINDGSTDNSGQICNKYCIEDSRFRVHHKTNGGVSSARNIGIEKANGCWITFIDSDDYISDDYFEKINENLSPELDILIFGYYKIERGNIVKKAPHNQILNRPEILKLIASTSTKKDLFWYPVTKVFRSNIVKSNSFNQNISLGEDTIFNIRAFTMSSKIKLINDALYYYITNDGSLTQIKYKPDLLNILTHHYEERKKIHVENDDISGAIYYRDIASYYINHILFWFLSNVLNSPEEVDKSAELKRIRKSSIFNECFKMYQYDWKNLKKSIIIKLFQLRQYTILLKLF